MQNKLAKKSVLFFQPIAKNSIKTSISTRQMNTTSSDQHRPYLIGLSGSSCSGKTTLCGLLKTYIEQVKHKRCVHVNMDDFYRPRDRANMPYIAELDSLNFDTIRSLDLLKFHSHLNRLITASGSNEQEQDRVDYIVLDGFLLYEDELVFNLLDKRYFLYLSREECARRRAKREYVITERPSYFDKYVWREYLKYKEKCEHYLDGHRRTIVFLNGEEPAENNLRFILADLNLL
jgi:uridine kinase